MEKIMSDFKRMGVEESHMKLLYGSVPRLSVLKVIEQ